jgi:hypothetical protein
MQSKFNNIAVDHLLIGFSNFGNLILYLILENRVIELNFLVIRYTYSIVIFLIQSLSQKHLQSRQLHDGSVSVLFGKVCIINGIAGLCTGHTS